MTRQSTHTLTRFGNWSRHTLTRAQIRTSTAQLHGLRQAPNQCITSLYALLHWVFMQSRNRVRDIKGLIIPAFCCAILIIPAFGYGQTLDLSRDNGAHWNYHDISYQHFRHEPFYCNPLVIIAGAGTDQKFNPHWQRLLLDRMIVTRNWWVPYPTDWRLNVIIIEPCIAAYAMMWKGLPLYYQFDYNADGHIDASDLAFFESEYGAKWDLSDFSSMGLIYNQRRQ